MDMWSGVAAVFPPLCLPVSSYYITTLVGDIKTTSLLEIHSYVTSEGVGVLNIIGNYNPLSIPPSITLLLTHPSNQILTGCSMIGQWVEICMSAE